MEKPIKPSKEDCCNSGCTPCIFDVYEKQLRKYEKYLETGEDNKEDSQSSQANVISQLEYTEFVVMDIKLICRSHYLLMFKTKSQNEHKKVMWKPGEHFLYKYISPTTSCTRAYTPFNLKTDQHGYCFSIVIKQYEHGLVSTHLSCLKEGDTTLWRGPYGHYEYIPNKFNRIVMIAQGTGIVPFISIIEKILNNEDDMTKITLVYCCKCYDMILFREELYAYQLYWNFKYNVIVTKPFSSPTLKYQEPIKFGRFSVDDLNYLKPFINDDQILVCGSPLFNEYHNGHLKVAGCVKDNIVLF